MEYDLEGRLILMRLYMDEGNGEYDGFIYGNVISAEETYHNSLRYCGGIQGIYGDLVYLRNRIYNLELKRFLTEDPIMDGSNWYEYCNNNPINFWDPLGLVPTMLAYIAEKNGGNAIYSEKSFCGVPYDKQVTVTINGITKVYNVGEEVDIINGKSVIDNSILMNDFGLTEEDSMHQPGDSFNSIDHAAIACGLSYNGVSVAFNQEYSSAIYEENNGYEYTEPIVGNDIEVIVPNAPVDKKLSGLIHSHGSGVGKILPNTISDNWIPINGEIINMGDIPTAKDRKVPMYLTTPSGKLRLYDYSTDKSTTLNSKMPKH